MRILKFWCLLLMVLWPFGVYALNTCHSFYESNDSRYARVSGWNAGFDRLFNTALNGIGPSQQSLLFQWTMYHPVDPQSANLDLPHGERKKIYRGGTWDPLNRGTWLASKEINDYQVLLEFLKNYEDNSSENDRMVIKEIESIIHSQSNPRQGFGVLIGSQAENVGKLLGTLRVFNGSIGHSDTVPLLPLEISYAYHRMTTTTGRLLKNIRKKTPSRMVFELGKHSFSKELYNASDSSLVERAGNAFDLFFLKNYVDVVPDDSLFFTQVLNPKVARKNSMRYGFRTIETVTVPGQREVEYIQVATAGEIKRRMRRFYTLPEVPILTANEKVFLGIPLLTNDEGQ